MTSTAMSRRQRRGVANHSARRSVRRTITVIISVLITIALFAGYCIADVYDVMPGMLTLKPVDAPPLSLTPFRPSKAAPSPVPLTLPRLSTPRLRAK